MIVTGDVCELMDEASAIQAVSVVKDQPEFEWPSMMVFSNTCCKKLTPEYVDDSSNALFDFAWASSIGDIPSEWNHCVGYQEAKDAKLYHYTQGIPCWPETRGLEDKPWHDTFSEANSTVKWSELMGNSIHAKPVMERLKNAS